MLYQKKRVQVNYQSYGRVEWWLLLWKGFILSDFSCFWRINGKHTRGDSPNNKHWPWDIPFTFIAAKSTWENELVMMINAMKEVWKKNINMWATWCELWNSSRPKQHFTSSQGHRWQMRSSLQGKWNANSSFSAVGHALSCCLRTITCLWIPEVRSETYPFPWCSA